MNEKVAKALDSIEKFQAETNLLFGLDPQNASAIPHETPATIKDLANLAQQAYYALDDIGEALKELSK